MNRREAIAALVSLPATTRVSVASLAPDDVIVVECDEALCQAAIANIKKSLESVWPGHRIVVCARGLRIKVVTGR